jgi:hypothetical protein
MVKMMRRVFILAIFLLAGCHSMKGSSTPSSSPANTVEPVPMRTPRNQSLPRELKLKLTLDAPTDLKVKQGDRVRKGQVIGDRTSARKQLEQQRQVIHLKLEHLNAAVGASSRPVSYAVELARVRQAQVRVQQAREAIALFKTHSPWTDYAWVSLPLYKESTQVSQLAIKIQEAESQLGLAVAQLQAARENKQEKAGGQDTSLQQVLLMSQLKDVEARLAGVGVVRSPYNGNIKKIKWAGQADRELEIELTLQVQSESHKAKHEKGAA